MLILLRKHSDVQGEMNGEDVFLGYDDKTLHFNNFVNNVSS